MKVKDLTSSQFEQRPGGYLRSVIFNAGELGGDLRVQHVRLKPGQTIKPHYHEHRTEVFLVLKGSGNLIVDGQDVADKSQLTLCQPGDVHEAKNNSDREDFDILVFRNGVDEDDIKWVEDESHG